LVDRGIDRVGLMMLFGVPNKSTNSSTLCWDDDNNFVDVDVDVVDVEMMLWNADAKWLVLLYYLSD
jgi:hypothetical protein